MITGDLDVDKARCLRVLRKQLAGVVPGLPEEFGPSGFRVGLYGKGNRFVGSVIVSQAEHDGVEWVHASIAYVASDPAYLDLRALKAAVFGPEREAYQVFPPAERHVNIHEHALHLWGRADGQGVLPRFGLEGGI